jgi:NTE family protein
MHRASKKHGYAALSILSGVLLGFVPQTARTEDPAGATTQRPRTCLVLGGGGARGAAHIGVLKVLEREQVPIDCIVGTSMGAIVGGLYASGYSADEIEKVLNGIDWSKAFRDDPMRAERPIRRKDDEVKFVGGVEVGLRSGGLALPKGFMQGQQLLLMLRQLFESTWQVKHFDELPVQFRCIAADIVTGDKVVFADGDVATAVRASMSVPGAFAPIRVNGRLLVDGGMVDNVPIDEARKLGAERLIVVAVGSGLRKEEELTSPFAVADQMLTALMQHRSQAQIATLGPNDLFILPELGDITAQGFDRVGDAVKVGFAAADQISADVRRYATDGESYAAWRASHKPLSTETPRIEYVRAGNTQMRVDEYIGRRFEDQVGQPFDAKQVEHDVASMYGEGRHESISWRLTEDGDQTGLDIDAIEKAWGPNFLRLGLELSDNFNGRSSYQALVQARFTHLNDHAGEGLARLQLGRVIEARTEYYQPWGWDKKFSIAPYLQYRALNVPLRAEPADETYTAELHRSAFVGGFDLGWQPSVRWRLSTGMERGHEKASFSIGLPGLGQFTSDIGLVRGRVTYDSLDSVSFPRRGMRLDVSSDLYSPEIGATESADVTRLAFDAAFGHRRNHLLLGLQLAYSNGGEQTIGTSSKVGGLANLSGYLADEVVANELGLARAIYYRKLTQDGALLNLPMYAGASLELGGFWEDRDAIDNSDLITAGSLFFGMDTILGPIFLGYGRAETGVDAFYLRIGPLLRSDLRL